MGLTAKHVVDLLTSAVKPPLINSSRHKLFAPLLARRGAQRSRSDASLKHQNTKQLPPEPEDRPRSASTEMITVVVTTAGSQSDRALIAFTRPLSKRCILPVTPLETASLRFPLKRVSLKSASELECTSSLFADSTSILSPDSTRC